MTQVNNYINIQRTFVSTKNPRTQNFEILSFTEFILYIRELRTRLNLRGKNQVYCLTIYKNAVNSIYEIVYAIVVDYFLDNQTVLFYAIVVDYSLDNQSWIISLTSKDIVTPTVNKNQNKTGNVIKLDNIIVTSPLKR